MHFSHRPHEVAAGDLLAGTCPGGLEGFVGFYRGGGGREIPSVTYLRTKHSIYFLAAHAYNDSLHAYVAA